MKIYRNGIYREMTEEEIAAITYTPTVQEQIAALKQKLKETDYKAIKFAEGLLSEEEYAPIRTERQSWRDEINALEQ